ncbi:hypothetical protein ZIOFF_059501 [Zingiber officinale]|uniref:Uncharacterized protein n=1 Tax=Zingiber officinale TaxID=94328 RepID=A0A8J5F4W3_ZINOF|nr:hypothetical protein ZIOFF_059501 [Zingiber officinale]
MNIQENAFGGARVKFAPMIFVDVDKGCGPKDFVITSYPWVFCCFFSSTLPIYVAQPPVRPVDEYGALIYAGRWGTHGVSLPGRVTFAPGNVGFSTFGAPRPSETQIISDQTWKLIDGIWDDKIKEIKDEVSRQIEEDAGRPQLLMADHFL